MGLLRNIRVGRTRLIEEWLSKYVMINKGEYEINEDYTIDVRGDVYIRQWKEKLPDYIHFKRVNGDFVWRCSNTTDLIGLPEVVTGDLNLAWWNKLTSLKGFPKQVGRHVNMICKLGKKGFTEANIRDYGVVKGKIFV